MSASTRSPLALPSLDGSRHARWGLAVAITLVAHGALGLGIATQKSPPPNLVIVGELELAPPAAPPPPKPERPEPKPEPKAEPETPSAKVSSNPRPSAEPEPAARAGKLLTANDDAPTPPNAEPVEFVTDPNGGSYSGGVVARGGTGDHGSKGTAIGKPSAPVAPVAAKSAPVSDLVPASDLSRRPALLGGSGCTGYYPREADADSGLVTVVVVVGPDGKIAKLTLAGESPAGQGFGSAARACMRASQFSAALDKSGRPVRAATTVRVRFTR